MVLFAAELPHAIHKTLRVPALMFCAMAMSAVALVELGCILPQSPARKENNECCGNSKSHADIMNILCLIRQPNTRILNVMVYGGQPSNYRRNNCGEISKLHDC
jgi:hypothetical protein